jgi:hypothetical protein
MWVVITTVRRYHEALWTLLQTVPREWKYILVYQDEPDDRYIIRGDGNIEVYISQNLHDYGSFVGVNMLINNGVVQSDEWFLFLHDTCKLGPGSKKAVEDLVVSAFDYDLIWLCNTGQGNICIIRNVIPHGDSVYNGMKMTKQYAIDIEYRGKDSIKSFPCRQLYLILQNTFVDLRYIYDDKETYGKRITVRFDHFDLEKYHR